MLCHYGTYIRELSVAQLVSHKWSCIVDNNKDSPMHKLVSLFCYRNLLLAIKNKLNIFLYTYNVGDFLIKQKDNSGRSLFIYCRFLPIWLIVFSQSTTNMLPSIRMKALLSKFKMHYNQMYLYGIVRWKSARSKMSSAHG